MPSSAPARHGPDMRAVNVRTLVVASLLVLTVIGAVLLLRLVASTLLLLLVAIVFAEGVRPLVVRFERLRLPRVAAIIVVFILLLLLLTGIVVLLVQPVVSEVQALVANFPGYQDAISSTVIQ